MRNKIKKLTILSLFIVPIIYGVLFFNLTHNEPFNIAKEFISFNEQISDYFGSPIQIKTRLFDEQHFNYSGNTGDASFTFRIKGSKREGIVKVQLNKNRDWKIISSNLMSEGGGNLLLDTNKAR